MSYCDIVSNLIYAADLSSVGLGNGYILYSYDGGSTFTLFYSTITFDASAYIPGLVCTETGWQMSSFSLPSSVTVDFDDFLASFVQIMDNVMA